MIEAATSPEFRKQAIKTRILEIAAVLADWKSDFFTSGVERPMSERAKLQAESARLALEFRQIGDAANSAKVERKKAENAALFSQLICVIKERGLHELIEEAQQRSDALANEQIKDES